MKLAIRILGLCIVLAGFAAASFSSATTRLVPSHQAAVAAMPVPFCGPGIPCGPGNVAPTLR
jgi:hypothetical protein